MADFLEKIGALRWQRLRVTLVNIRVHPSAREHPVSIVNAIIKGVTIPLWGGTDLPLFHIRSKRLPRRVSKGAFLPVEIIFVKRNVKEVERWAGALRAYLADPETGKNYDIAGMGPVEERCYGELARETGPIPRDEVALNFLVPFAGRKTPVITASALVKAFERWFSMLFGDGIVYDGTLDFSPLPYGLRYDNSIRHESKSQRGNTQYIDGLVGRLYLKGDIRPVIPFVVLGSELHFGIGGGHSCSRGYYELEKSPPGHFCPGFPSKEGILAAMRAVVDEYDSALESLTSETGFPFDETRLAERLCGALRDATFAPAPAAAFRIRKKGGAERVVERYGFADLVVQRYLLNTVRDAFDRLFETESMGYRKGASQERVAGEITKALRDGYTYIAESDIDDFFPSVDHGIMESLLERHMPGADAPLKKLLLTCLKTGYILDNAVHERKRGLSQGSPLSPVFANLYLDSFDERIKESGVRFVRYADDFVMLARTRAAAEELLSVAGAAASRLGLALKEEKTAVKTVAEGFEFLGVKFGGPGDGGGTLEEGGLLKKPLYITEPWHFLSVNGGALDVKRDSKVVMTIPFRRISEIMVMERSVISTDLMRKCTERNIPLTVLLNSGYYITTVKPDSKRYFDISFEHGRRHRSLTEAERLAFAREIAASKLNGYVTLFKQRFGSRDSMIVNELRDSVRRIYHCEDADRVRGVEGAAARKVYSALNGVINDPAFHIAKRDRKAPDRINSLMNFGYYLLFSRINATMRAAGLNPYLGMLHSSNDDYESFAYDIQELFRAQIDRFIARLINLKAIQAADFTESGRGCYLKSASVKRYLELFETEMNRRPSLRKLSLKQNIHTQVEVIKKWVFEDGSLTFYSFLP